MDKKKINGRMVLNTKEAAEYLGIVSHRTLEKWRRMGRGPDFVNIEGRSGYRISDLDRYLEECSRPANRDFVA